MAKKQKINGIDKELARKIVSSIIKGAVDSGELILEDLDENKHPDAVQNYLRKLLKQKASFEIVVDHRETVLKKAKMFHQNKEYQYAVV